MAKYTLDSNTSETPEFSFEGVKGLIINGGQGEVKLLRSVAGSPLLTLYTFNCENECAFNGILEEKALNVKYKFTGEIVSGEVDIYLSKGAK